MMSALILRQAQDERYRVESTLTLSLSKGERRLSIDCRTILTRMKYLCCVLFIVAIAVAASPLDAQSGRLLVLNKEDATLAIVDPASGKVLGTVPVGQGPHELVTSTDGKWAFASNYGTGPAPGHTISMIDVAAT